jgi:hypothetical protein
VTPSRFTASGSWAVASETRFWVLTCIMSTFVPTSKVSALQLQHRSLRDEQRACALLDFDAYPRVLARSEDIAGIREDRADPNGARFWINLPIGR